MTQYADNSNDDALARVIEAFAGQSVPEGPDAFTKRRLVAALRDADRGPTPMASLDIGASRRPRRYLGLAAAATVAAVATAGVLAWTPGSQTWDPAASTEPAAATENAGGESDAEFKELVGVLQEHLRLDRGRVLEKEDVVVLAAAVLQANPNLAKSPSWRVAQEKLSGALERPEVIGLSLGVISTLPQFARF
jgi:hypothetical protein